jgi:hypothetical protein
MGKDETALLRVKGYNKTTRDSAILIKIGRTPLEKKLIPARL